MKLEKWKLRDVILMAIFGVVFSAIYLAVFDLGVAISTALTPLGLAAFGFELIYGVWFMASTLAAYIIRKPGVALVTEILASAVELLMGNPGGMTVILTGIIQGLGVEIIFLIFRYKKWNFGTMSLASMAAAILIFCYELYYLSYYKLTPVMMISQVAVRLVSAVVFSGVICKLAADGLAKTGVLKGYPLGEATKSAKVYATED